MKKRAGPLAKLVKSASLMPKGYSASGWVGDSIIRRPDFEPDPEGSPRHLGLGAGKDVLSYGNARPGGQQPATVDFPGGDEIFPPLRRFFLKS